MSDKDVFDLSRRKVLAGLGTIGAASAGVGLGTSAYFSDEENFTNNQLVAGELDMKMAYSAHYSDWKANEEGTPEDEGVDVVMYDGAPNTTGGPDDLPTIDGTTYTGLPTNAAWLIAVDDPDLFLENTQYSDPALDGASCEEGTDAEDLEQPVIDLDDVKPGDFGEITFDFALCDNPGFVWLQGELVEASENGYTEPERKDPQEDGPEEEDTVELLDVVQAAAWVDDGDNYQDGDEAPAIVGSLRDVLEALGSGKGLGLGGDISAEDGGGMGPRNCFSAETEHSVAFAWWVPIDHGNEIQTDTVTFDLSFYTEQCRHNDGMMEDGEGGVGEEPGDGDVEGDGAISFLAACVSAGRDVSADEANFRVTEILDTDDAGEPTAVKWKTDDGIDSVTVKYGSSTPPVGPKFTTYRFSESKTEGTAVTGADEDGAYGDEDGSPETTGKFTDSDQTESEPCPHGYTLVEKLEEIES